MTFRRSILHGMSKTSQRLGPAQMPPDPLTPYLALPLPKSPATKPDVVRKPPAVTPEAFVRHHYTIYIIEIFVSV